MSISSRCPLFTACQMITCPFSLSCYFLSSPLFPLPLFFLFPSPSSSASASSASSLIRQLTLDILDSYPWRLPLPLPSDSAPAPPESIFSLMSSAESTPVSVQTYRERLVDLRRLDFAYVRRHLPVDLPSAAVAAPLRFLCGNLLINFKLLWDPVKELIKGTIDEFGGEDGLEIHERACTIPQPTVKQSTHTTTQYTHYTHYYTTTQTAALLHKLLHSYSHY